MEVRKSCSEMMMDLLPDLPCETNARDCSHQKILMAFIFLKISNFLLYPFCCRALGCTWKGKEI